MISRLLTTTAVAALLCFASQTRADWVMDFRPGLALGTNGISSFSMTPGANFTGSLQVNHNTGHTWTTDGVDANEPIKKANIRYEFPSLRTKLAPNPPTNPNALISFSVPLASNANEGVFSIIGTAERASGATYIFTNDSGGTPDNPNGDFEWITSLTTADLVADDIVALDFEISFDYIGGFGFDQTFTFGGAGGLIAAPEPTSAAMIGCVLVGFIARRRRKS